MATRMEYLILLLSGLSLTCAFQLGDHSVEYEGQTEVHEGDAFQIVCELPIRDPSLWTINSSIPILEDNNRGYQLSEGEEGSFRREEILNVRYAQLFQEGEYRCNRNSRDFHYVSIIPALADDHEQEEIDDDDDDDDEPTKRPYEYNMEINETYEFSCTTAKDEDTPVTWYKNGGRIIDDPYSNVEISGRVLYIVEAQEDDAGEYMCIVEPQYDAGYLGEGRIFRLISPTRIIDMPDLINIVQGETVELHCRTQGYPEPKITWLIGNLNAADLKKKDRRISLHSVTRSTSTLIIRDLTEMDRGLCTCRAENTVDPDFPQIDEESVFIHVRENMIQVNEDYPGMGKVLKPGEPLVLVCNTTECPHCTVIWFKDGEPLNNTDRVEILGNNTIVIDDATYNDSGIYVCKINRAVLDVDLQATIVVQSKINIKKFEQSTVVVQGSPLELHCQAEGGPMPLIKWYRGDEELDDDDDERIKIVDHEGLKNGKLIIEDADFPDRNHYTCEAYNQIDSVNTTIFVRVKDKLAALWPFLGICAEVAILCTIIFVYERRKSMNNLDEPDTDLPTENKHQRDQKAKGHDVRQRK